MITKKHLILLITLFFLSNKSNAQKTNWDSLSKVKQEKTLAFLNLKEGDNIADIGTGNGYSLVPIAGSNAALKFTVEDIDSSTLNIKKLEKQIKRNGSKAKIEQFKIVYGTETSTKLPSGNFNKVLLFDVIHELSSKKEMFDELKRILQKGGSIFIEEILVRKPQKKDRACNYPFYTEEAFKALMLSYGFILKKEENTLSTKNKFMKLFEYTIE
jgi:ubiquinone/menaquinone biosynthesis C-methylase UbiE